jgi:hypothetical protein
MERPDYMIIQLQLAIRENPSRKGALIAEFAAMLDVEPKTVRGWLKRIVDDSENEAVLH